MLLENQRLLPQEKRSHARERLNMPAVYFPFTSFFSGSHAAMVLNASRDGLYLECSQPLYNGQCICIRPHYGAGQPPPHNGVPIRTLSLAQVRWCRHRTAYHHLQYGVGLQYM